MLAQGLGMSVLVATPALCAHAQRPRTYVVVRGDTVARVARRYHIDEDTLRAANRIREDRIREGQELVVPRPGEDADTLRAGASGARAAAARGPSPAEVAADARARRLGLTGAHAGHWVLTQPPQNRWVIASQGGSTARLRGDLLLPVRRGEFIRGWGSGPGGYHLALDIRGAPGVNIVASERGMVLYAGDQIQGYGNFVMIQHPNGWITCYAHNRRNLVRAGQLVTRGQVIGTLGATGLAQGPHLHYMLIRGGEHCDMVPMLSPHIGRRARGVTYPVRWRGRRPPVQIQCLPRSARPHPSRRYQHGHVDVEAEDGTHTTVDAVAGDDDSDISEGAGAAEIPAQTPVQPSPNEAAPTAP